MFDNPQAIIQGAPQSRGSVAWNRARGTSRRGRGTRRTGTSRWWRSPRSSTSRRSFAKVPAACTGGETVAVLLQVHEKLFLASEFSGAVSALLLCVPSTCRLVGETRRRIDAYSCLFCRRCATYSRARSLQTYQSSLSLFQQTISAILIGLNSAATHCETV